MNAIRVSDPNSVEGCLLREGVPPVKAKKLAKLRLRFDILEAEARLLWLKGCSLPLVEREELVFCGAECPMCADQNCIGGYTRRYNERTAKAVELHVRSATLSRRADRLGRLLGMFDAY